MAGEVSRVAAVEETAAEMEVRTAVVESVAETEAGKARGMRVAAAAREVVGWEVVAAVEAETVAAVQVAEVVAECPEVEVGGGGAHLAPLAVELAAAETA